MGTITWYDWNLYHVIQFKKKRGERMEDERNLEDNMIDGQDDVDRVTEGLEVDKDEKERDDLREIRENHDKLRQRVFDLENDIKQRDKEIEMLRKRNGELLLQTPKGGTDVFPTTPEKDDYDIDYLGDLANRFRQ